MYGWFGMTACFSFLFFFQPLLLPEMPPFACLDLPFS